MSLEFLIGASGHGKTYNLYNRIIEDAMNQDNSGKKFVLIVPEQSSLQAQKDIVRMHPNGGVFNIDVLTFGRLAYRIFEELATTLCETIDDTGKNLIIRKVMTDVADRLKILHANRKFGVVTEVKSMISEFKQYGITTEGLAEIIDKISLSDRLKQKLNDVLIIYQAFEDYISERYVTAEDKPEELLRVIGNSDFFNNTVVAFDGFTGFTPVQYRLFEQILLKAEHVINTVTLPEDEQYNVISGEEELFYMSKNMMRIMGDIADKAGVKVTYTRINTDRDKYRFAKSGELDFLEKELFRYSGREYDGDVNDIHIRQMSTPQEEVRLAAADILKQVREKGLRYREIAVVTGDMSIYGDYIQRIFSECEIPFFMDRKRSLIGNPAVEYIRSAIEIVQENFSYESVFRFLKNGLSSLPMEQVDVLENYVLSLGIRGHKRWQERFVRPYPGKASNLEPLNASRAAFIELIEEFYAVFSNKDGSVHDKVKAIYELLEQAQAFEYLEELSNELENEDASADAMARAAQCGQTYKKIIELLEQLDTLLGDEVMSVEEFSRILDAGFEEIKVGVIPPSADCVTVGDVERTRLEHVKVLFVLGVNEGILPKISGNQGVLSENERKTLVDNKVELAPTPRQRIFIQNFYLYLNLTEPEEGLFLSCHRYNAQGKESKPSRILSLISGMYPKLHIVSEEELLPEAFLANTKSSMHLVTDGILGGYETREGIKEIITYLMNNEPYRSDLQYFIKVSARENLDDELSEAIATELYREIEKSSISRIETFAKCAFSHFVRYGLELEERKIYEINQADMGNIFHKVIEMISFKLHSEGRDFSMLGDNERYNLVEQTVMDATIDYNASFFLTGSKNAYLKRRIINILDRTIWALGKQLEAGRFKPNKFEETFFEKLNSTAVIGKIDRVDMFEEDGKVYVKVVDYKSGANNLSLDEIYNGVKLQLMVYLKSVLTKAGEQHPDKEIIAAGALYNRIDNPIVSKKEDYINGVLEELRPTGMVSMESTAYLDGWERGKSMVIPVTKKKDGGISLSEHVLTNEQLKCLSDYAADKMEKMTSEIQKGEVKANPFDTSCAYCPYKSVCGFDSRKTPYRKMETVKDESDKWIKFGYKRHI